MLGLSPLSSPARVQFDESSLRSASAQDASSSRAKSRRSQSDKNVKGHPRDHSEKRSRSKSHHNLHRHKTTTDGVKVSPVANDGTPRRRVHKRTQALRTNNDHATANQPSDAIVVRSPLSETGNAPLQPTDCKQGTPSKKLSRSGSLRYIMSPGAKLFKSMNARMLARSGSNENVKDDETQGPDTPKRKRNRLGTLTTKLGTLTGSSKKRARKDVRSAHFEENASATGPGCVFGVPLETVMRRERERWGPEQDVPTFVENAISRIVEAGLDVEGIFRLSVDHSELMELRRAVDGGKQVDFSERDPLLVACFLKQYLRELPADSLFPVEMHQQLFEAVDAPGGVDIFGLKMQLSDLPDDNWRLLRELLRLWALVASHSASNKMTAGNMAITNGPNILKTSTATAVGTQHAAISCIASAVAEAARASRVSQILEALICNVDVLFDTIVPGPTLAPRLSSPARTRHSVEYSSELQSAIGELEEADWAVEQVIVESKELPQELDDVVIDLEGALTQIDDILDMLC